MEKEYLIQHLILYVDFQLENGYELKDIADALLHYGYKREIISEIIKHFKDKQQRKIIKKLPNRDKEIMREDMALYIQNMLIDYIKKQQKLSFSLKSIERALIQVGHHRDVVQKAIKTIKRGEYVDFQQSTEVKKYPLSLLFVLMFIISIAIIFMISVATNENILLVFITFTPLFIGLILLYALVTLIANKIIITITPPIVLIAVIGVFFYLSNTTTIYKNTDMQILLGLNIVIAFFAALIISIFGKTNLKYSSKKDRKINNNSGNNSNDNSEDHSELKEHINNDEKEVHQVHTHASHSTHDLINILEDEIIENREIESNINNEFDKSKEFSKESNNSEKKLKKEKIKIKEFLP